MAEPRQARVMNRGPLLGLQLEGNPDVVLKGGKYIIINTGLNNAEGKLIKRAYSLFAVKPEGQQFFLAAAPVTDGIASAYLQDLGVDDVITFSGPWGKFHWPAEAAEKTVVAAAFGSGITGVLGYLASVPADTVIHLYWYQDAIPLVHPAVVQECAAHPQLNIYVRLMQDDPLHDLQHAPLDGRYITAGEGERVDQFLAYFRERGVPDERLQSEIFYRAKADG